MQVVAKCPQCRSSVAKFEVSPNPDDSILFPIISVNSFLVAGTNTQCVIESGDSYIFRCSNSGCKWHKRFPTGYFNQVLEEATIDSVRVVEMIPSEIEALHREYELNIAAAGLLSYVLPPDKFSSEEVQQAFLRFGRYKVQILRGGVRQGKGTRYNRITRDTNMSLSDSATRDFSEMFEQCWSEAVTRATRQTVS